MHFLNIR